MAEPDPYSVPDGGTLRVLDNGLEIVRRQKLEWRASLEKLPPDKLARRTGKVWGSKFYPEWTLPILIDWIVSVIVEEQWRLQPGEPREADRRLDRPVGLAGGGATHRIRVVSDGRYVHAYPIEE
jgi:hypothetical protein